MNKFVQHIKKELKKAGVKQEIALETPPDPKLGDYAFPCFPLAKEFKKAPQEIAEELAKQIKLNKYIKEVEVKGPYLNFFVNKHTLAELALTEIEKKKDSFGEPEKAAGKEIMVEFCQPNTNKPLHLGHLRNIFIGESVSRLLGFAGNKVMRANLLNDRGVHICQSMYAYQKWGKNKTPNKKTDHFVGDWYVLYGKKAKDSEKFDKDVKEMLKKWEEGDKEVLALWKKMNKWALDGFEQTYKKLGITFDKEYFESDIWAYGRNMVMEGVKKNIFKKNEEGAIIAELEEFGMPNKVVLRADGTTIYMTTDIYLAKLKFDDYPQLAKSIYVAAQEQDLHFKQLFKIMELLKYKFANKLFHLSYGLVNLPEGRMKSREGIVVDADDLIAEMERLAKKEIKKRHKDLAKKEIEKRATIIGLGALRFHILKVEHVREMTYDPEVSISFEGETGPYVQYVHARCCSILRKSPIKLITKVNFKIYQHPKELTLITLLAKFPGMVKEATEGMRPSTIAHYLIHLAQTFNEFYTECPVIQDEQDLMKARLLLVDATRQVIKNGLFLLGIEAPEKM